MFEDLNAKKHAIYWFVYMWKTARWEERKRMKMSQLVTAVQLEAQIFEFS